jgi:hypothetical protein
VSASRESAPAGALMRRFVAGVLLGSALVGTLFAAAEDNTDQVQALLWVSGLAFVLGFALQGLRRSHGREVTRR